MSKFITKITQKIEYLACFCRPVFALSQLYYKRAVGAEIKLGGITSDDNVLFIGGGVCPFSAILLHKFTGCSVTVIDNQRLCVNAAAKMIDRLGLSQSVRVIFADGGDNLPLKEYTVVHFAMQISPLYQVISHVRQGVSPGTKLLIRRPKERLCALYCPCGALQGCRCVTHGGACNIGSTLLYVEGDFSLRGAAV